MTGSRTQMLEPSSLGVKTQNERLRIEICEVNSHVIICSRIIMTLARSHTARSTLSSRTNAWTICSLVRTRIRNLPCACSIG
jgi:hypothetical protein